MLESYWYAQTKLAPDHLQLPWWLHYEYSITLQYYLLQYSYRVLASEQTVSRRKVDNPLVSLLVGLFCHNDNAVWKLDHT